MRECVAFERLIRFASVNGLLNPQDERSARNMLAQALALPMPFAETADREPLPETATPMLESLVSAAVQRGVLPDTAFERDRFGAHLMNLLTPPPSKVHADFEAMKQTNGAVAATDWFYALCRANDSIRVDQIARNHVFDAPCAYGELTITINLSKPEKDPRDIAREKDTPSTGYPLCMLCAENEGYQGRPGYPSHETLRLVPISLSGERWFLQYSPYAYYPEHCIALNSQHTPMAINRRTFTILLSFVDQFPHYFIGSNADLPIVGGSILGHDHFQGGRHTFAMDRAQAVAAYASAAFPDVRLETVRWPMTCLRLSCADGEALTAAAALLLDRWRGFDDPSQGVLHATGDTQHNTITPIARKSKDGIYTMYLVLRNNRATDDHPLGLFHPHANLHHIKRENIGLIEVMGLFILPGRLKDELYQLKAFLTGMRPFERPDGSDPLGKHFDWVASLAERHGTSLPDSAAERILQDALTEKCVRVLEDAGVLKQTPEGQAALNRFLKDAGFVIL